jgi:hypothetical protein
MNVRSAVLAALARLGACQSLLERIQQEAVLTTYDADVAYYYDAGLDMAAASDRQPGNNMRTEAVFYDTNGALRRVTLHGLQSERVPVQARYRTLALQTAGGSVAVFPAHFADTVQAIAHGLDWTPPFKSVLKAMGVDASMLMDFHGDGHPNDLTDLRLDELHPYFAALRAQSDSDFLLIPAEEANVHLGGHCYQCKWCWHPRTMSCIVRA